MDKYEQLVKLAKRSTGAKEYHSLVDIALIAGCNP